MFGVSVALLPVVKQRDGSAAGHALAKADIAMELETTWPGLEAICDWMYLENARILQRKCSCLEANLTLLTFSLKTCTFLAEWKT